jgi:hypothetical protein
MHKQTPYSLKKWTTMKVTTTATDCMAVWPKSDEGESKYISYRGKYNLSPAEMHVQINYVMQAGMVRYNRMFGTEHFGNSQAMQMILLLCLSNSIYSAILDGLGPMFVLPITHMNDGIPPPIGGSIKKFASPSEENTMIIANINEIRAWLYYHILVLEMVNNIIAGAKLFFELVNEIDLMLMYASRHATFDIIGNLLTKMVPKVDCHVTFAEEMTTNNDGNITMVILLIPVNGMSMENLELLDEDNSDMDTSVKSAEDDNSLKLWMGNLDLDEYLETGVK